MTANVAAELNLDREPGGVYRTFQAYLGASPKQNPGALIRKIRKQHRGAVEGTPLSILADKGEVFLNEPWLTPVLGSGPLGLPHSFLVVKNQLDQAVLNVLKKVPRINDNILNNPVGADPDDWLSNYVRQLVSSRTGGLDASEVSSHDRSIEDLLEESGLLAAEIALVAALTTRYFFRISLDVSRPFSRWGSERAIMPIASFGAETSNLEWDIFPALEHAIGAALDRIQWEEQGLLDDSTSKEERNLLQFLRTLLEAIHKDASPEGRGPLVVVDRLAQVTEAAWTLLLRAVSGAAYPGWNEMLLRLLIDDEMPEVTHSRPRWTKMKPLCDRVAEIFESASRPPLGHESDSEDRRENKEFYDSLAKVLWSQARAKRRLADTKIRRGAPEETALQPLAIITSFDVELEMALLRTAGEEDKSFSVILPVIYQRPNQQSVGKFTWVKATVMTQPGDATSEEFGIPSAITNPAGEWTGVNEGLIDDPVVVRLTGCPLVKLPVPRPQDDNERGVAQQATARWPAKLGRAVPGLNTHGGNIEHVISLDESTAIQQSGADLQWSVKAAGEDGMPSQWFTNQAPTGVLRHWMLFGVPYQDPAVRNRLMSVLARPRGGGKAEEPNQTDSAPTPPPDDDTGTQLAAEDSPRHDGMSAPSGMVDVTETPKPGESVNSDEPYDGQSAHSVTESRYGFDADSEEHLEASPLAKIEAEWLTDSARRSETHGPSSVADLDDRTPTTDAVDFAESAVADDGPLAGIRAETEPVSEPEDGSTLLTTSQGWAQSLHGMGSRGLAVGLRLDDADVKLLNDLGLDIVTDRAELLTSSLGAAADWLDNRIAEYARHQASKGTHANEQLELGSKS